MQEQEQKAHSSEVHTLLGTQISGTQWQEMRLRVPLGPSFDVNNREPGQERGLVEGPRACLSSQVVARGAQWRLTDCNKWL